MISSGNMYTMKNKGLQKIITRYYLNVDANRFYLRDVNKVQSQLFELTPEIYPYKLLISQLNNPQIDINSIDTTWINNPKTPTYLAVITYLNSNQELNNIYRRSVYQRSLKAAEKLTTAITEELENKNK